MANFMSVFVSFCIQFVFIAAFTCLVRLTNYRYLQVSNYRLF